MLDTLPPDILDHIAYFAGTYSPIGPPSGLVPLLGVSRSINAVLNRSANPHLYARIFETKFDCSALSRRFEQLNVFDKGRKGDGLLAAHVLSEELVLRCRVLTRIRTSYLARADDGTQVNEQEGKDELQELLLVAFVMTLENEGRNVEQLRRYAHITDWLAVFWFDLHGASRAVRNLEHEHWPLTPIYGQDEKAKLRESFGMWLLWFYLDPSELLRARSLATH